MGVSSVGAGRTGGAAGRSTRTRAPELPGSGSTNAMLPPCRSVTQRAMASPRPVPPPPSVALRVPNGSNARSLSSGCDARSLVGDLDPVPVVDAGHGHPYRPAGRAVSRRVVEQVGHQLPQPSRVGADDQVGRVDADVVLHGPAGDLGLLDGLGEQLGHGHRLRRQRRLAGVDAGQVEQVGDQASRAARPGRARAGARPGPRARSRRRGSRGRPAARPAASAARG